MARHSDLRFQTGKDIAACLSPLARLTIKGNATEKELTKLASQAVTLISAGDITELSRREVYAAGRIIEFAATRMGGAYANALESYAKALTLFTRENDYGGALQAANAAVTLATQHAESRGKRR